MKFVKKVLFVLVALCLVVSFTGCKEPTPTPEDPVQITFTGLNDSYTFKTGDPFSQDILLKDVEVKDQNGNSYKDKLVVNGLNTIPLNEDGTLKQAGSHTVKISVVVDGTAISTKIITIKVEFVMEETDDIIYNGDFATGTKDPFVVTNVDGSVATIDVVDQQLVLSIDALSSWQEAFPRVDYPNNIKLEAGKFYEVSFDAKATVSRHVHVQVGELLDKSPWFYDQLAVQQYFLLTTEMKTYSFRFAATQGQANLDKLSLLFGHGTLPEGYISEVCDVVYDNIKIVEVDSLGADVTAPSINASDKSVFVGTELEISSLYSVIDDQDTDVEVAVVIKDAEGNVVDAIDYSKAGVYTVEISATDDANNSDTKTITLTVKEKVSGEVAIEFGEEGTNAANGGWNYWNDQNWAGSNVVVSNATVSSTQLNITYTMTGLNWFGLQLFFTDANIPAGEITVKAKINASVAGDITIAGQKVSLEVGDNDVNVVGKTSAKATLGIQFGVEKDNSCITGGSFVISELTINDVDVLTGAADVNPTPNPNPNDENLIVNGDEGKSVSEPGTWIEWHDQNWCGSNYTMNEATIVDGTITIDYSSTGFCWFGLQLFYTDSNIAAGDINVKMNINASVAGDITIAGQKVTLVVGDNVVNVVGKTSEDGATLGIQFGVLDTSSIAAGKFVITNVEITNYSAPKLSYTYTDKNGQTTSDASYDSETGLWTITQSFIQWGNITLTYADKAISSENTTVLGDAYNGDVYANGSAKLYQDLEGSDTLHFHNSTSEEQTYVLVYDHENNTLTISLPVVVLPEGLNYSGSQSGEATHDADKGTYTIVVTLPKWNFIVLTYVDSEGNEKVLSKDNTTMSGAIRTDAEGDSWEGKLYYEGGDSTKWYTGVETGQTYTLVYNPTENTLEVTLGEVVTPDPDPQPTPSGNYTVTANTTDGAANNFTIKWSDAAYKPTQAPVKEDCSVTVGMVANFELINNNDELLQVNIITGADSARNVSIILHTAEGDYKLTMVIENGKYASFTEESVTCYHQTNSDGDSTTSNIFTVTANTTSGAANNFTIKWSDATYKPTQAPVVEDCGVSVGKVDRLEYATLTDESLVVNIITGADSARNVSVILHTAEGDYKLTMVISEGVYRTFTVETVDCAH